MKLFGIVGYKNTGKTGLMERLVTDITGRGITVSTIKHAHHSFDVDHAGKDSYRHREAGASQVMLSSGNRWALMSELRGAPEPDLHSLIARKIEAYRAATNGTLLAHDDPTILAVASDCALDVARPVMDLNATRAIADFILKSCAL